MCLVGRSALLGNDVCEFIDLSLCASERSESLLCCASGLLVLSVSVYRTIVSALSLNPLVVQGHGLTSATPSISSRTEPVQRLL